MGNSSANPNDPHFYDHLDVPYYQRQKPTLNEREVKQIYRMFVSYDPKNNEIKSEDVLRTYADGADCEDLKQ